MNLTQNPHHERRWLILGVIAILTKRSAFLKELAYAGFFYDFILAASAHINAGDGILVLPALVCLVLLIISYVLDKKLYKKSLTWF